MFGARFNALLVAALAASHATAAIPIDVVPATNATLAATNATLAVDPVPYEAFTQEWLDAVIQQSQGVRIAQEPSIQSEPCPFQSYDFPCTTSTATDPAAGTDVYHLRPQDVKVVMAIGDSMTAGFAMTSGHLPSIPLEFRGQISSAGADDDNQRSVFTFLRRFNPQLIGGTTGFTGALSGGKELNQAVTGNMAADLPGQVDRLVTELANDKYAAARDQWKLANILIGANDVCKAASGSCVVGIPQAADSLEKGLREALEKLRTQIGKVFVNVIGMFRFSDVFFFQQSGYCKFVKGLVGICKNCGMDSDEGRKVMDDSINEFNKRFQKVAAEYANKYPDFTVSYQPAITDMNMKQFGGGLISNWDCFHPNKCANEAMALALWNNMFTPPGQKTTTVGDANVKPICPDSNVYLQ